MTVVRGKTTTTELPSEDRAKLLGTLVRELSGQAASGGPVIFEIPLDSTNKVDVLVVWDAFRDLRSEDRTDLILDAYDARRGEIAQALGVTHEEAFDQNLLPYSVVPMARLRQASPVGGVHGDFPRVAPNAKSGEVDPEELRSAMIDQGGIALPDGRVVLRLPTMVMAEAAHRRLCEILPRGYWSLVQTAQTWG